MEHVEGNPQLMEEPLAVEIRAKKDALTGLMLTLKSIEGRERRQEASAKVPLALVFGCLAYPDDELVALATQLLEEILHFVPFEVLLDEHLDSLSAGLDYPIERVVLLAIQQLERFPNSPGVIERLNTAGHFDKILFLLENPSSAIAQAASGFLLKLAKTEKGREMIFSQQTVETLKEMFESSTTRFRVFSLFTALCEISRDVSERCVATGILFNLVEDLKSPDPLVKLNAIELCSELLQKSGSGNLLVELGVFNALSEALNLKVKPDAVDSMCASRSVIGFCEASKLRDVDFSALARAHDLLNRLKKMMYDDECPDVQEAAVTGLGVIGSTPAGLLFLENEAVKSVSSKPKKPKHSLVSENGLLFSFVDVFTRDPHARQELKIALLQALALMLDPSSAATTEGSDGEKGLLEKLVESLEMAYEEDKRPSEPALLLKLVKEPKELVRYAAYGMLQNLVVHPWGKKKVVSTPGLLDFLLDRSTESEKLGKEWKFAVVQGLGVRINLHHDVLERIQRFLRDGPFFAGSQVAVEGVHL